MGKFSYFFEKIIFSAVHNCTDEIMISRLEFNFKSDSKVVVEEIVVNENANALEKSFCLTLECSKWVT